MPGTEYLVLKLSFFLLAVLSNFLFSQDYPQARVHHLLQEGINNIINSRYDSAERNFRQLSEEFPMLPLGDIYSASVKIARSYDNGEDYDGSAVLDLLQSGRVKAKILLEDDPGNNWNRYFLALAEGYSAYFNALRENWITAFTGAVSSADLFRQCLAKEHGFFEAYSALGTYYYWKSRKLEPLSWLPFFKDDTEEGIKLLQAASDSALYSRYLAVNSLIWIYIDQKRFADAAALAENILKVYPESRYFKWGLARALEETDKERSIKIYYEILDSYDHPSIQNELKLKHKIAQQHFFLGNNEYSLKLCREILSKKFTAHSDDRRIRSRLERVAELMNELLK
jgi:hypothetical protein